ncbi:MAG TPA: FHA domain-containing protein [Luteitalea sp.]|nr:FHA domain-containing protein [Luteitalea sp.]
MMDVTRLAGFGRDLQSRLRQYFEAPLDGDASPLEIGQAVLDDVERRVQPVGRGQRVFPYTQVVIRVLAVDEARASVEAVFEDFSARLQERLAEVRCEPRPVSVTVECVETPCEGWRETQRFDVRFVKAPSREAPPTTAEETTQSSLPPALHVVVLKGAAAEQEFTFEESTVSIGRSADPTDGFGRVRRNRIAFLDTVDGVNETVGRAHARLRFDAAAGDYRLFDDGSSNGTSILRDGEVLVVHRRDPRGVRVRSGDEIQIGRALLRVTIG